MQVVHGHLYDFPQYYDLVFGSDWKAEFDFLQGCFARHASGKVRRLFEPACGTGRLVYRLAKAGFEVSGLDLNERAVNYCNRRLARHGLPQTAWVGDMCEFRLPKRADAAFNTINSFRHLTTAKQAKAHLTAMAEALRPGGIYVLGLHLTPTASRPMDEESWSARRGNLAVNTHMVTIERNLAERRERFRMTFDVYTPTRSFRLEDEISFRTYTARQMRDLIAAVPAFQLTAAYAFAYDLSQPLEIDSSTADVVLVLKTRAK